MKEDFITIKALMIFAFLILLVSVFAAGGLGIWIYNMYNTSMASLSTAKVLELTQESEGEITVEEVCENTGVTRGEARIKLYTMLAQGTLEYDYDNYTFQEVFSLSKAMRKKFKNKGIPHRPNVKQTSKPSDGEIISLAIRSQGRITATALCLKANISVDKAKERLNELHEKGVFEIKVTENGTITYIINDIDLLREEN